MRVLAFGDIHGCLAAFDALLDWVKPTPDDVVVTLGDYVDRGPDTRGVIERLIAMQQTHNLICLRGNHEVMMVDARTGGRGQKKMWLSVGGVETLASYGIFAGMDATLDDVPAAHWDWLATQLVDYYESDRFIFVHASVLPEYDMDAQPDYALLWEFLPDAMRHHSGKTVVCGHTSQKSGVPKVVPGAVCIDTRAFSTGWLTCLDVHEGRYWQTDMCGNRREGRVDYEE
ncbi:serine threonine protein phosphatase : Putative phosphohydrolase OS=Microcoleus sp. PCC 7113 GN=Mic7113_1507 PE=4 SV=1: Metallophos [Gemmataceae bacterium]|nr:serine threonine protein phosphatase : Putative phosphohydrolase OS=Microcoleus sp. PCC 7113 GN=Mic7113_1507 PE=4 SV=1: Metallophos [Gemmataceae bacterium]VTU02376.1 serine threonine protein phosphatase : Putative phosphohydrolase OS=Microcoleus sp. PCC 7113 GN=Mic7113_1507 PE=4 SV=1: Metallophos [Gemmataceae bacterium]